MAYRWIFFLREPTVSRRLESRLAGTNTSSGRYATRAEPPLLVLTCGVSTGAAHARSGRIGEARAASRESSALRPLRQSEPARVVSDRRPERHGCCRARRSASPPPPASGPLRLVRTD